MERELRHIRLGGQPFLLGLESPKGGIEVGLLDKEGHILRKDVLCVAKCSMSKLLDIRH